MDHRIFWIFLSCIYCEIYAFTLKCEFDYYELVEQNMFDKNKVYYTCFGKILTGKSDDNMTELSGINLSSSESEYLFLDGQKLTFFPKNSEKFFPNLQIIDVSRNSITEISNEHLRPHHYLTTLLVPHNQISIVESNLFDGLTNLKIVDFSYNKVKQVGYDIKLPINGELYFLQNPCVDMKALTPGDINNLKSVFRSNCVLSEMHDLQEKFLQLEKSQAMLESKINNITTENGKENIKKLENEILSLRNQNVELERNQIMLNEKIQRSVNKTNLYEHNFKVLDNEIIFLRNKNFQLETYQYSLEKRLEHVESLSHLPGCEANKTEIV